MHEGRYQAQKGLMLRVQRPRREKGADVEIGDLSVSAQKPPVSIGTAVKDADLNRHSVAHGQ